METIRAIIIVIEIKGLLSMIRAKTTQTKVVVSFYIKWSLLLALEVTIYIMVLDLKILI